MNIKKRAAALLLCMCMLALLPGPGAAGAWTVVPSRHAFTVDGRYVRASVYNIGGNNYFRLRDMAMLLKDTDSRFSVEYDSPSKSIIVGTGIDYEPIGGELELEGDLSYTCVPARHTLRVNGAVAQVQGYNIGGNNYYRLRDLGQLLNFYVDYDSDSDTAMVVSAYYIRHTDVYNPMENVTLYCEIPVFRGNTPALNSVNRELMELERGILSELRESRSLVNAPAPEDRIRYTWTAKVDTFSSHLISVTLSYENYLGGAGSEGFNGYVFDAETGGRLFLPDVLGRSDEDARETVASALASQYPALLTGSATDPRTIIRRMSVLDLDFAVVNGSAVVYFDKYEIAAGAEGALRLVLPDPLTYS